MEKKKCPECGEPILGRSDKKFCSDMCRNSYNNKLNSDTNNYVRQVNNTLRKNRRILEEFLSENKTSVHKDKLIEKGFSFNYFTGTHTSKKGTFFYRCYEFWYSINDNSFCYIMKSAKDTEESAKN